MSDVEVPISNPGSGKQLYDDGYEVTNLNSKTVIRRRVDIASTDITVNAEVPDVVVGPSALGASNAAVTVPMAGHRSVGFFLAAGTLVGTLTPELSYDGGTTWIATSFLDLATGAYALTLGVTNPNPATSLSLRLGGGVTHARVRVSTYVSGTANGRIGATATNDTAVFPVDLATLLAGEDITNNVLRTEQQGVPFAINSATTTVVASAPGHVYRIRALGGTLGGVTIYNNTAASGTVLVPTVTPLQNEVLLEDIDFSIGLTIVTATAMVVVGSYR